MLKKIDEDIYRCNKCNHEMVEKFPKSKTVSTGTSREIVIVGEAPANNGWRKSGVAFYDVNHKVLPSGVILQRLLSIIDIKLENTYFLEAIKCYPKDRKYLPMCTKNCREFLVKQLNEIQPEIILTLGDAATKAVLDIKYKNFSEVAGKEYFLEESIVIPIYHPSPISPKSYTGNVPIFKKIKEMIYESVNH
ncbi:MAG: uracil-DNA glycosylase family protein [Bacilli bacterium]|nr:uracil-DNA glycosylase family protein [Bacilli bacterium]